MHLHFIDPSTLHIDAPREISPGLIMPRWVRMDRANIPWLADQIDRYIRRDDIQEDLEAGPDHLTLLVGGTDWQPTLIIQNTRADGSNGGTLYLSESDAPLLAHSLRVAGGA